MSIENENADGMSSAGNDVMQFDLKNAGNLFARRGGKLTDAGMDCLTLNTGAQQTFLYRAGLLVFLGG
ncbi:MAG: hypothetical protein Q8L69_11055 [Gallionellaceae bacterium]|nr:hypothetical protein [Gallionellaceae bacterium]